MSGAWRHRPPGGLLLVRPAAALRDRNCGGLVANQDASGSVPCGSAEHESGLPETPETRGSARERPTGSRDPVSASAAARSGSRSASGNVGPYRRGCADARALLVCARSRSGWDRRKSRHAPESPHSAGRATSLKDIHRADHRQSVEARGGREAQLVSRAQESRPARATVEGTAGEHAQTRSEMGLDETWYRIPDSW